ncbi:hypothetical protein ABMA27_013871 [Loxostege sticticalis]|uniref:Uncharacterized protein n=1 Tax=Loxostege sticticalis TaxID=481309 RepID=A0ABR3IBT6_LOXSC
MLLTCKLCFRKSGRHMKFPYTLSAKIAQFPIFHYMKNNMIWMYYPYANQRSWAETQRKAAEKEHH